MFIGTCYPVCCTCQGLGDKSALGLLGKVNGKLDKLSRKSIVNLEVEKNAALYNCTEISGVRFCQCIV